MRQSNRHSRTDMNPIKRLLTRMLVSLAGLIAQPSLADTEPFMAEGVVRKLDPENRKITLKHGDIKNLNMPGMTMVFRLQEKVEIDQLKPGDKVMFHVEKIEGAYTITDLQAAP